MRALATADAYAGAGGFSTALMQAIARLGAKSGRHICVNHWDRAIKTHSTNHPKATHYCDSMNAVNPVMFGKLDAFIASPECTFFSTARGAKPINDQRRTPAKLLPLWIQRTRPEFFLFENVKEFRNWGPLYPDDYRVKKLRNKPIPARAGETFEKEFMKPIMDMGYSFECRVLNCADYGDPTTRRRLFMAGRRDGKPVEWPEPTHNEEGTDGKKKWVAAKEIIDWSVPACSIFATQEEAYAWAEYHGIPKNRAPRRPLTENTLRRIAHGIEKYWGDVAEPFLTILRGQSNTRDMNSPLPTMTTGQHLGVIQPFMVPQQQGWDGMNVKDINTPMPTVTSKGAEYVVQPFLTQYHGGEGGEQRAYSLDDPIHTVDCGNRYSLVKPFLTKLKGTGRSCDMDKPVHTITAGGSPFGVTTPFLQEYYSNGGKPSPGHSVNRPLPTVTCQDRFGVVTSYGLDIRYRMLQPHELQAAMSFPKDYEITGTKTEKVRQIGNAVPVRTSSALIEALLKQTLLK